MRIWDLASRTAIVTLDGLPPNLGANFSPDGQLLAICIPSQSVVKVVKAETGEESYRCEYADAYVMRVSFSPDGNRLFACGNTGIRVWDAATGESLAFWPAASSMGARLAFSPDGRRLAIGGTYGVVELCDSITGQLVRTFKGHSGTIRAMAFNPDGTRLATGGVEGTVRVWDTSGRNEASPIGEASAQGEMRELSLDGQTLLTGTGLRGGIGIMGGGKSFRLWDTATAQPRGDPIEMPQMVRSYDWTGDGKHLYLADLGKTVTIVDVATSKIVRTYPADFEETAEGIVTALSPNEKWYAHSAPERTIRVRDAQTGDEFRAITGLDDLVHNLAFSADGSRLASADHGGVVKIWDVVSGSLTATTKSGVNVMRLRFSPDGQRLAVVGNLIPFNSAEVRILDADSGRESFSLKGHTLNVTDAVFSPDGQRLATESADRTIRIWDLDSAQEILKLSDFTGFVTCIRFAADGRRLIGACGDRTVRVWDATPLPE
jgi:WD40 repeat protein